MSGRDGLICSLIQKGKAHYAYNAIPGQEGLGYIKAS